jgi:citrate lyase beta subunit
VEAAKGHLETWIRDAASPEEVAQLASGAADFCATCLTKTERLAFSKLISEVTESFAKAPSSAEASAGEAVTYTLDAVKAAGKALAAAKGLPAVETVLSKFDSKVFRDIKEKDYAAAVEAFNEALS